VIGNDGGGGEEMVRSSEGRSFQRRGGVIDSLVSVLLYGSESEKEDEVLVAEIT